MTTGGWIPGGNWARMEERWFQVGDSKPIQEGDMTLLVAKLIAPKLRKVGAPVSFVRDKTERTQILQLSPAQLSGLQAALAGLEAVSAEGTVLYGGRYEVKQFDAPDLEQRTAQINQELTPVGDRGELRQQL